MDEFRCHHPTKPYLEGSLMKLTIPFCSLLLVFAHVSLSSADNSWAQWRGPMNSRVSASGDPPVTWSETENIKWKVAIDGNGTSTPIIWEDNVFVLTAVKTNEK